MSSKHPSPMFSDVIQNIGAWQQGQPLNVIEKFVESLCELYLKSKVDDQRSIREAVRSNQSLWNFACGDDIGVYLDSLARKRESALVPYLRDWLTCISITGGTNWKDTLHLIELLHSEAIIQGIDIRSHVKEIAESAEDSDCRRCKPPVDYRPGGPKPGGRHIGHLLEFRVSPYRARVL